MLEPNPGMLLKAVADSLTNSVTPHLSDPNAKRQLQAIIHIVRRLQRSWDLAASLTTQDNNDIDATIGRIFALLQGNIDLDVLNTLFSRDEFHGEQTQPIDGVNDPHLEGIMSRNMSLRHRLETLEQRLMISPLAADLFNRSRAEIDELHRRTTQRNASLVGNSSAPSIGTEQ